MAAKKPAPQTFQFGVFELDLSARELRKQGVKVKLQEQPFQVLQLLLEHTGQVVTKEELQKRIWPSDTFVDFDHGLHSAITRLREALGDSSESPRFIETLARRGYRFIAPVREVVIPDNADRATPKRGTVSLGDRLKRYSGSVLAGLLGGAILLALFLGFDISGARRWLRRQSNRPVHSLAVLPLQNLSGDLAQEYFADGMTDALITNLAQLGDVRLISRSSVMQYKGSKKPLPTIARELNVDAVVEGSVQRSGQLVRITAQLVDARSDAHLWANSYERALGDVLILQSEISRAIVGEIRLKLTPQQQNGLARASRVDPEVQEAYLQGRYHLNKGSEEEIRKGIGYFQQALGKNPRDARPYAGLADSYLALSDYYISPAEILPKAKEAAIHALDLDEGLAEAHTSAGAVRFMYDWDWAGAEKEFKRAIELNPGSSDAHVWYGLFLAQMSRTGEAIPEVRQAESLDPLSLAVHISAGFVYYLARQDEQAIAEWKKALDLDPQFAVSHSSIWVAYVRDSDFSKLLAGPTKRLWANDDLLAMAALAATNAVSGRRSEAERILARLAAISRHRYVCPYEMATAHAVLGRKDESFRWLQRSFEERSACLPDMKTDPRLDALRSDSRFQDLLRRVGLLE